MWRFFDPQSLWWFFVLGLIIVGALIQARRFKHKLAGHFNSELLRVLTGHHSTARRRLKFIFKIAAVSLMILSLARPQRGEGKINIKSEGIELILAVDVSRSMLAEDSRPNRLELVKAEAARFLDLLTSDRVGLIAFAGSAVPLSPLTQDKAALRMFLEGLSIEAVSNQGTDLGRALGAASELFRNGGLGAEEDTQVTRAVILFSDGEDNETGADSVLNEFAQNGIKVFAVAVGSAEGAPIPVYDGFGRQTGYHTNHQGQTVTTKPNPRMLKKLADRTGGNFYQVTLGGSELKDLREDLRRLKQTEFDTQSARSFAEKYFWPLALAYLLALVELTLGERKARARRVHG